MINFLLHFETLVSFQSNCPYLYQKLLCLIAFNCLFTFNVLFANVSYSITFLLKNSSLTNQFFYHCLNRKDRMFFFNLNVLNV